jgi:hypothetical protein
MEARRVVNFGCGATPHPGCLNLDGSLTVLLATIPLPPSWFGKRRANFVTAIRAHRIRYATARWLNLRDGSIDGFYASHVLEHLSRIQCVYLLKRLRAWLADNGVLRIVLPDPRVAVQHYMCGDINLDSFIRWTELAADGRSWWRILFGHSRHRWLYDFETMRNILAVLGYSDIREVSYRKGSALSALDIPERAAGSLYIEAFGPADGTQGPVRRAPNEADDSDNV